MAEIMKQMIKNNSEIIIEKILPPDFFLNSEKTVCNIKLISPIKRVIPQKTIIKIVTYYGRNKFMFFCVNHF